MKSAALITLLFAAFQAFPSVLSDLEKLRADQLISVFENETLSPQYAYIEKLNDGRGYTAGRAGFCTGCGDLLEVVELYTERQPKNGLAKYIPTLRKKIGQDSVNGLEGLPSAWRLAARDNAFRKCQDEISDKLYYLPALQHSERLGLIHPLSKIAIYEANIQHGGGDDPDGVPAMIERATIRAGGLPSKVGETTWLGHFLIERRATLMSAHDPDTRDAWRESVGRADVMLRIFQQANWSFVPPLRINPYGQEFSID